MTSFWGGFLWGPRHARLSRCFRGDSSFWHALCYIHGIAEFPAQQTESEKAMATIKTKKVKTAKGLALGLESPADDRAGKHPKKLRKVNLKDLIDDDDVDSGDDKLVGGVAGALLGGVAGALLGGVLGVMAESFKSAASDDDYEVEVDEEGNIEVGSADDDDEEDDADEEEDADDEVDDDEEEDDD